MLIWPETPGPERFYFTNFENGDSSRVSIWKMSMHTGTHIDAPGHILAGGCSIDQMNLSLFFGPVFVLDQSEIEGEIKPTHLKRAFDKKPARLLLKTSNSIKRQNQPFDQNYVGLSADGAQALVDQKISLVGIDYIGIEPFINLPNCPAHEILMKAKIPIIEGLDLKKIKEGNYLLCCFPLSLEDSEASIARAILIEE